MNDGGDTPTLDKPIDRETRKYYHVHLENHKSEWVNGKEVLETKIYQLEKCNAAFFTTEYEKKYITKVNEANWNAYCIQHPDLKIESY